MRTNSKIINFEVFSKENDSLENTTKKKLKNSILEASKQGYTSILGLMLVDGFLYKNNDTWNQLYNDILDYANSLQLEVKIVTGQSYNNKVKCTTIPFNFNLHTVYNSYKDTTVCNYSNTNKFLFLGGVPDRPNRIGLLYELYKRNLLQYAEWSFFTPWTLEQKTSSLQYFSSTKDYYDFIKFAERKIDNVYEKSKTYGTEKNPVATEWTNNSSWIDPAVYTNTGLSIISEGHPGDNNNNSKFLTEKTYRVFVQGHPFLFAGNVQMFEYIKDLGFKTFENYLPYPEYATVKDESKRLKLLVDNLEYVLHNRVNFFKDVEYNKTHFFNLAKENARILKTLNASSAELDHYFNKTGFGHLL